MGNFSLSWKAVIIFTAMCYVFLRLYFFLVSIPNSTVFLKSDSCELVELFGQKKNNTCSLHGDLRNDLFSNDYILKLDDGSEIYLKQNAVDGIMRPAN